MEQASPIANFARARLSFQASRQHFNHMLPLFAILGKAVRKRLYLDMLFQVVTVLLPERPNRHEPRVVKRRPKPFPRMRQPRSVLKASLAN